MSSAQQRAALTAVYTHQNAIRGCLIGSPSPDLTQRATNHNSKKRRQP